MNKTKMIILAGCLCASATAMAQTETEGKFALGIQGGLSFSHHSIKDISTGQGKRTGDGFLGGVFAEFGVGTITLRPEINYVSKEFEYATLAKVTNYYLEIPLLVKVNPFAKSLFSPFFVAGPAYSSYRSSSVDVLGGTTYFQNNANRWDLSGLVGAGLEVNVHENLSINTQARYSFGLRDIDSSAATVNTRAIYAIVGLSMQY